MSTKNERRRIIGGLVFRFAVCFAFYLYVLHCFIAEGHEVGARVFILFGWLVFPLFVVLLAGLVVDHWKLNALDGKRQRCEAEFVLTMRRFEEEIRRLEEEYREVVRQELEKNGVPCEDIRETEEHDHGM